MKNSTATLAVCTLALISPLAARAQATEGAAQATATPSVPSLNRAPAADQLSYSLGASESVLWGYNNASGVTSSTALNGSAAYVSGSQAHPTSFLYSGGYLFGNGAGTESGAYQNLGISQQFLTRHFGIVVGDTVSYLPNAPVFGLSGVPGVGDIGTQPISTGGLPVDSILTDYGRRLTNTTSGSVSTRLSESTSLNAFGAYTIQRFIDGTGIDNNETDAGGSLNHRMDAKNSFGAGYNFSRFGYLRNQSFGLIVDDLHIDSSQANLQYQHVFTRRLTLNVQAGPQWIESTYGGSIPSQVNFAANASLFYLDKRTSYLLAYSRGTSTGGGVLLGTISDNANFTVDHEFTRRWRGSFSANYGHAQSLIVGNLGHYDATSFYTGVQATRLIGRFFSAYASYNLEYQDLNNVYASALVGGPVNAFSGTANILGFGVNYSPRPIHMRRH